MRARLQCERNCQPSVSMESPLLDACAFEESSLWSQYRAAILNLRIVTLEDWVSTGVGYQIFRISNVYVILHDSNKITVT